MPNLYIKFIFFLGLYSIPVFGQQKITPSTIRGLVVDSLSGRGIPYVQVFNENNREYIVSNEAGNFNVSGSANDTLVITVMGYFGRVWISQSEKNGTVPKIFMIRRIYDIEPVEINNLPVTYKEFKKAFLNTKPDQGLMIEGLPRPIPKMIPQLLNPKLISATETGLALSITYIYNIFSKEVKSEKKLIYLQQEQKEQIVVDQKFNRELVHRLTGLENDELTGFINFCHFEHVFLYKTSDYEIVKAIHNKFEEYQKIQRKTE
jgi:hypothetical protein